MPPPETCPECGGKYIRYFGAGTQKVEEEVQKLLPGIATARMDYDTTGGKDGHGKILEEFRSGRARILIGTQMIAESSGLQEQGTDLSAADTGGRAGRTRGKARKSDHSDL